MNQIRKRFVALFISLFALFFLVFNVLTSRIYENENRLTQQEVLSSQLSTLVRTMEPEQYREEEALFETLERVSSQVEERITVIAQDGEVLYDSLFNPVEMENHGDRPEVSEALETGGTASDERESETAESVYYYIAEAVNIPNTDEQLVIRLSKEVSEMIRNTEFFNSAVITVGIMGLIITVIFTELWARRLFSPLGEIKNVALDLAEERYEVRFIGSSYDEVEELGHAINELADNLETHNRELRTGNIRLKRLIENLNVGIMLIDGDRHIQIVNPAMNEILGVNLTDEIGKKYMKYIRNPWLVEMVEAGYDTEESQSREVILTDNEERILDGTVIPVKDELKEKTNLILLLYDITEIRRLEKVRTDFVANASHELRTPVTALKGFTETILDGGVEDEETLIEFLEIMHTESIRLDSLVGDILQLSKLEQNVTPTNYKKIRVRNVVESVIAIIQQKADSKNVSVIYTDPDHLEMEYDENMLKQILLNLVNNAVLYTGNDGNVIVKLAESEAGQAIIEVKDNGMGIPEKEQDRIFERFYRVDKARSRNAGGTGLGLSIVKHMVENTEGTIELRSQYGKGASFIIHLPLYPKK